MGKLWSIIKREYLERVRTRWFLIATVFGPLLFGAMLFLPPWLARRTTHSTDVVRITILDASDSPLGRRVALELNGGPRGDTSRTRIRELSITQLPAAESAASRLVLEKRSKGYLVLDRMTLTEGRARYAGSNASAPSDMRELQRVLREQVLSMRIERAGVDPAEAARLTRTRVQLDTRRLTASGRGESGQVSILFAVTVAFVLYLSMFIYGQAVLRGVMEEKQSRVAEVVISSVPAPTLLAGKVLGVGGVGLTQLLIWLGTSVLLFQLRGAFLAQLGTPQPRIQLPDISPGMAIVLLLFFLLGYTFYAALFAAVGAMVSSEQEAQQAQMPVVLLLVASVMVLQPVLSTPEGPTARLMSLLPFSAPIVMPLRMSVISVPPLEIALSLFCVLLGCYIAVFVAARIYRVGMLMYGKRPTPTELMRWLRQAR